MHVSQKNSDICDLCIRAVDSDGFLHIFVSTGCPISHKIIQRCPFMQTALALQNHAESFFPAYTQSPEISNFGNIFAVSK